MKWQVSERLKVAKSDAGYYVCRYFIDGVKQYQAFKNKWECIGAGFDSALAAMRRCERHYEENNPQT